MDLTCYFKIEGTLYKPVLKDIEGLKVIDLIPVRCGTCKDYIGCEREVEVAYTRCEKWEMEKEIDNSSQRNTIVKIHSGTF